MSEVQKQRGERNVDLGGEVMVRWRSRVGGREGGREDVPSRRAARWP